MLNTSETYRQKIFSDDRRFLLKAEFCQALTGQSPGADGVLPVQVVKTLTGADSLVSMTLEESAETESRMSMGTFCSAKLTMELIDAPSSLDYGSLLVRAYSGLVTDEATEACEYVPLGLFYITEAETSNNYKNLTITAYDGVCRLEEEYTGAEGFPMDIETFVSGAAAEKGFGLCPDNVYKAHLLTEPMEGYTYRQMIGFAAGLCGANARFDRLGRLQFYWYDGEDEGLTVPRKQQYLNQLQLKTAASQTVTSLTCVCGEKTLVRGEGAAGTALIMENPYMTEAVLEEIWQERIADMENAETVASVTVTYDGTADESRIFTAVYNQSMECLRVSDPEQIAPGALLEMSYHLGEEDYTERILVTQVDEDSSQIAFSREEQEQAETALPDGLGASLAFVGQWRFETMTGQMAAGDTLYSSQGSVLTAVMVDARQGELYLADISGDPVLGMEPGTQMALTKRKVTGYRLQFQPAELKWRGTPAAEPGDLILAQLSEETQARLFIMNQVLRLGGGMNSQIACYGQTEAEAAFSSQGSGPVDKKLDRVYTSLQQTIIDVTEKLTGQKGGYVVINESEKGPAEILIMDTNDIRTAKKVWRWNQAGLGYSASGYEGPFSTAITSDGEIVGSFIQAESIAGSKLAVDSSTIEKIITGINAGQQKISSAVLEIDSEDLSQAIRMEVSETGGFNRISNSAGVFGTEGWICRGTVNVRNGSEEKAALTSASAFELAAGASMVTDQTASPVYLNGGKQYTLSAAVKHNGAAGSIVLSMSGAALAQIGVSGGEGGYTKYSQTFTLADNLPAEACSIEISSVTGLFTVGDLILTEGIQTAWSPYPGEISSAAMSMSQFGIAITQENAKTKTIIDAAGTRVVSIENGDDGGEDVVAEYTKDGVEAKNLIAREQVAAGRVRMVSLSDRQMAAWIINSDTEVDL